MKKCTITAILLCAILSSTLLAGCGGVAVGGESEAPTAQGGGTSTSWDETDVTQIKLAAGSATIEGEGAVAEGGMVTISAAGRYRLSGVLEEGQVLVQAPENAEVHLILDGADIRSATTAAVACMQAGSLTLTAVEGSENRLSDAAEYRYEQAGADEPDAALFSKVDLTINGSGKLVIQANYNNGIGGKDDLVLADVSLEITAVNDAIRGRDSVMVTSGKYTLKGGGDGIQSNNDTAEDKGWIELQGGEFFIEAGNDGVQAETTLKVLGGEYEVLCSGGAASAPTRAEASAPIRAEADMAGMGGPPDVPLGETMTQEMLKAAAQQEAEAEAAENAAESGVESGSGKALKAGAALEISGGKFTLDSAGDALHSNGSLRVVGGSFSIAAGDDGMHADLALTVGGNAEILITQCYEGLEGQTVTLEGGQTDITASDDGVNAAGGADTAQPMTPQENSAILITGGELRVKTGGQSGGDGLDSNGDITLSGGLVVIDSVDSPADGALDCDGVLTIDGGVLMAAGGMGMICLPGEASAQPSLLWVLDAQQMAGVEVALQNAQGETLTAQTLQSGYTCLLISAPGMTEGESYTLTLDGQVQCTVTLSGGVTAVSQSGQMLDVSQYTAQQPGGGRRGQPTVG